MGLFYEYMLCGKSKLIGTSFRYNISVLEMFYLENFTLVFDGKVVLEEPTLSSPPHDDAG